MTNKQKAVPSCIDYTQECFTSAIPALRREADLDLCYTVLLYFGSALSVRERSNKISQMSGSDGLDKRETTYIMKIGLQVNNFTWEGGDATIGETFGAIGRRAEEAGFDSLWVMDHFFQISGLGPPEWPMLEGYSALTFIAGQTSKIKLGTMVTGVTYRHPGILVKTATTLDVLSGGRSYFGVGAAWFEREHLGLGVPFPPLKDRFEMLEELLQIAHQMWSGEVGPYNGKHYQLAETLNSPQPISKPHPPILVGGGGPKVLDRVLDYGTSGGWMPIPGRGNFAERYAELQRRAAEQGHGRIPVSVFGGPADEQAVDQYREIGADRYIFSAPSAPADEVLPFLDQCLALREKFA